MKKLVILTIFSAVLCLTYGSDDVSIGPQPPNPTPQANSSTTASPPPPPPTTHPTTSSSTTTAPTSKPTTTQTTSTTAPNKTTTASTTTSTTTSAPITTAAPTPKPKPEEHTWVANYTGTNKTCIILKMIMQVELPYRTIDNKTLKATVLVPPTANLTSSDCVHNTTQQSLTLTWNTVDSITFTFKKNDTKFVWHSVVAKITPDTKNFPNASNSDEIVADHRKDDFSTPVTMSYRCKQNEYLDVELPNNSTGRFIVSNLQVQAFRDTESVNFDSAKDCEAGETPGVVPIAVGCSLAALIIIVLIGYLWGRRRSQARGYLSM